MAYIINKLDQYANQQQHISGAGWIKEYINGSLHYIYYFANITNDEEFSKKLESVELVKRENIMHLYDNVVKFHCFPKNYYYNSISVHHLS